MREISDYHSFKDALQELFQDLKINPKCNVILNLPMVHFGKVELPLLLNDDSITEAVISEVEQTYIFKRCEPLVSWFDAQLGGASDTRTIFYSAIQKNAVDKIRDILAEMGATLSSVQISLVSILRALLFSGKTEAPMENDVSWNLMIVNSNGYSLVSLSGKNIVDYYEEPLALKTYEPEEVYDVINTSAQIALINFPANYLYVVSETDLVSAEHLISKLSFEGKAEFLENNTYRKREILSVSLDILPDQVMKITLESVGIAVARICDYPIKLDFSGNKMTELSAGAEESISFNFNDKEIILTESVLKKMSLVLAGILIVPSLAAMLTLPILQKKNKAQLTEVKSKIKNVEAEIKRLTELASESGKFVIKAEVENVLKYNRAKLIAYSALGESVPADLWLTYFSAKSTGQIDIKGVSEDVEGIYIFFKNMKDSLIDTKLRLHNLEMVSNNIDEVVSSDGDTMYNFEITNMTEADLKSSSAKSNTKSKNSDKKSGSKKNTKSTKKVDNLEPVDIQT